MPKNAYQPPPREDQERPTEGRIAKNLLGRIGKEPLFRLGSIAALAIGALLGWLVHWFFPFISLAFAVFIGAVTFGAVTQMVLTVRYAITFATEVAEDVQHEVETDRR